MAFQAAYGHMDLMFRAAQPREGKRASNRVGPGIQAARLGQGCLMPGGEADSFLLDLKIPRYQEFVRIWEDSEKRGCAYHRWGWG